MAPRVIKNVVDHGQHGGEAVSERVKPPPKIDDDDNPTGQRRDQGQCPGLAGDRPCEVGETFEQQVAIIGQDILELGKLRLHDLGFEIRAEDQLGPGRQRVAWLSKADRSAA